MHPGMMWWWKHARGHHGCGSEGDGAHPGGGVEGSRHFGRHGHGGDDFGDGGSFGVRRPLRFLAYKLNLNEEQVSELAKILDELKTERAQAAVDDRRTVSAFADALGLEKFDEARAKEGGDLRVKSGERLRDAVVKAMGKIHALLDSGQRAQLAYLIRTGVLSL
jgi:Spy/CpxP family protein refolding chaperone